MSKKQQKQAQLSPVNYIKQKARSLPIVECLITSDWEDCGMCNIVVTRQHVNGNYTVGLYLVDIYCLGVKDADYRFNISDSEYEDLMLNVDVDDVIEPITYNEVHNIIYGALAYAEDLGFGPHKDFGIAQYILEEDTDDIPLIEYEFGQDGMPALFVDTAAEADRYLPTLEKAVGNAYVLHIREDDEDCQTDERG